MLASVLGGAIALMGFKYFYKEAPYESFEQKQKVRFSSYLNDTTVTVPTGLNFVYSANLVRSGVVHIKTEYEGEGIRRHG